jgi:hypothetical protein
MPVVVQGAHEMIRALGEFDKDLRNSLNRETRAYLAPVVKQAKVYVPDAGSLVGLRKGWTYKDSSKKITKSSSMFRVGTFPKYNTSIIKNGIKSIIGNTKSQPNGWVSIYRLVNQSRAGAIYEVSGRAGGMSKRNYKSPNPNAGKHFMAAISATGQLKGKEHLEGRLLYRAWNENQGRALAKVAQAVQNTEKIFANRTQVRQTFGKAA